MSTDNTEKTTEKIMCPVFGDLGATIVPWGSPEHLSMQHGYLRGLTRQGDAQPAEKEPLLSPHPDLNHVEAPDHE